MIRTELDPRDLARIVKRAERWRGRSLSLRMEKGVLEAARYMVRPMRSLAKGPTGRLSKTIKATNERRARGLIREARVGPHSRISHLVVRGTKPHSLAPKDDPTPVAIIGGRHIDLTNVIHPGATANPFVDEAAKRHAGDAIREVSRILIGE